MIENLFLQVLNMSFSASFVIFPVLLIRLLLKRTAKIFTYILWAVVLLRLICPVFPQSPISLLPAKPSFIEGDIIYSLQPKVDTGIPILNSSINSILPAATPYSSINPIQVWLLIAQLIWLTGIVAILIYNIICVVILSKKIRSARLERDNIYILSGLASPFVMGLFRPRIYIPESLSPRQLQFVSLHEETHIKRLDHVFRLLSFLALCIHWFNPLVWLAFALSGRDMEMACDERVIKLLGPGVKKEYSSSLLGFSGVKPAMGGGALAFGEGDTGLRIKNVLSYKRPSIWAIVISVLLIIICFLGFTTNPSEKQKPEDAGSEQLSYSLFSKTDDVDKEQAKIQMLESRLEDTLVQLDSVDSASVKISLAEGGKATALVNLKLSSGKELGKEQSDAIIKLVKASVANLSQENITIQYN